MTDEDKISRRYRELPREEPPRHLDEAILAAARRAVHTRPAPLVVPSGRQRWYFPLAAAAIIVLAVAVTVHMEREQPAEEMLSSNTVTAPAAAQEAAPPPPSAEPAAPASPRRFGMRDEARAQKPAPAPSSDERAKREAAPAEIQSAPGPAPSQDANAVQESARAEAAAKPAPPIGIGAAGAIMGRAESVPSQAPAPAPQAAPPPAPEAKPGPERSKAVIASKSGERRADAVTRDTSQLAKFAERSPEQWLQGIADLRRQGRHEEADKELAEFRKRYPKYQISPEMRKQVEKS